ncbi:NACHT domain-containing protein [Maridesulfovibrio frigidus]|uniref:NACHT domain-containing protein n=1 Tax=Maridesulfovibrio frigidus TaxID=340956 RepID=UPI0004E1DD03|nr:hypothetical protein [Maridesulfovibrio frigidus]
MMFWGIIILVSFFVLGLLAIYIYLKRKKYTRERFAFMASSSAIFAFILIIQTVFVSTPWAPIAHYFDLILGAETTIQKATIVDKFFIIILFAILVHFFQSIFKNWNGLKSVKQFKEEQFNERQNLPLSFLIEGISEINRITKGSPPSPEYKGKKSDIYTTELLRHVDNCAWNEQARSLIKLKFKDFLIDEDDWHDRASCWIGKDKKTHLPIAIYCPLHQPDTKKVAEVVDYIKNNTNNKPANIEIFVITQEGPNIPLDEFERVTLQHFFEEELLKNLADFSDYAADIRKQVEKTPLPDSSLTLKDTYVQSHISTSTSKDVDLTLENFLEEWLRTSSRQQIALLGEYGQGKSSGSLMFTYNILCSKKISTNRIPILIDLRGKSPSSLEPKQLVAVWAARYNIAPEAVFNLLISGKLCIIFEGFDEMQGVTDKEARMAHFAALWNFCYPKSKIIITGRPNFFLDEDELKQALGIDETQSVGPSCKALYLKPFNAEQVQHSLRNCEPKSQEEIVALFKSNNAFKDVAARPSLLYIISILWNTEKMIEYRKTQKITSALIMSTFIDHCCNRQTEKQDKTKLSVFKFMTLNDNERRYFMSGIAVYMMRSNKQNQIRGDYFKQITERLYENIPASASAAKLITENPQKNLRKRLQDNPNAMDEVYTNVRSYGLLVRDLSTNDSFKFPHKSFLEYLYAEHIANHIKNHGRENYNAIQTSLAIDSEPKMLYMRLPSQETIEFAGEIVAKTIKVDTLDNITQTFENLIFTKRKLPFFFKKIMFASVRPLPAKRDSFIIQTPSEILTVYSKLIFWPYDIPLKSAIAYKALVCATGNIDTVDSFFVKKYGKRFLADLKVTAEGKTRYDALQ